MIEVIYIILQMPNLYFIKIYEALDKIIIDGLSLRERLINTDFDFDFIS